MCLVDDVCKETGDILKEPREHFFYRNIKTEIFYLYFFFIKRKNYSSKFA